MKKPTKGPGKKPAPAKAKRKLRQMNLANVMTGPEVQKALGGVSHVTVHNLATNTKLGQARLGKAKQQGGGWLWSRKLVTEFARTYKPQPAHRKKATRRGGKRHKRR